MLFAGPGVFAYHGSKTQCSFDVIAIVLGPWTHLLVLNFSLFHDECLLEPRSFKVCVLSPNTVMSLTI